MRGFGIETFLHGGQDFRDVFHVDDVAVGIEHFDESAHVRTLKVMRQIHKHADGGNCVLMGMGLVANTNWETQVAHTYLVDAEFAMVAFLLGIS